MLAHNRCDGPLIRFKSLSQAVLNSVAVLLAPAMVAGHRGLNGPQRDGKHRGGASGKRYYSSSQDQSEADICVNKG
jgi:hypothetical protein